MRTIPPTPTIYPLLAAGLTKFTNDNLALSREEWWSFSAAFSCFASSSPWKKVYKEIRWDKPIFKIDNEPLYVAIRDPYAGFHNAVRELHSAGSLPSLKKLRELQKFPDHIAKFQEAYLDMNGENWSPITESDNAWLEELQSAAEEANRRSGVRLCVLQDIDKDRFFRIISQLFLANSKLLTPDLYFLTRNSHLDHIVFSVNDAHFRITALDQVCFAAPSSRIFI